jgi:predicted transcriptional regulator
MKLFDSELKVMDVLWKEGDLSAGMLAKILNKETGWNRNTTYTVIKKCIDKGAIERYGTNFICKAMISKEKVQEYETAELINRMYDGSVEKFFAAFLNSDSLSQEEINKLKEIVDQSK